MPGAPEEDSTYTVWVPVTSVMFAGMVRHEAQPTVFALRSCRRADSHRRSSCEVYSNRLHESGGHPRSRQRSPCPRHMGAQNAHIWTVCSMTSIGPSTTQITAGRRAFSLAFYVTQGHTAGRHPEAPVRVPGPV